MRRAVLVALARAVNAVFFFTTSSYCLLTYSSFAYQQFIKPHLVNWLTGFVVWHHLAFWLMLILTAWTLLPELRHGRWRGVAWSYLVISAAIGIVLLAKPVLPEVENNGRGLALAVVALLPPIWLAIFDHRKTQPLTPSSEDRVFRSAFIAALLVWACQVAVIPWRWDQTGGITLGTRAVEYWLIVVVTSAVAIMLVTNRIVFAGIAFSGAAAWTLSIASSYGGVYAVHHDGSRMYIADGVNGRDYAYDLTGELSVRIGVTPATRAADQQFIRTQVDDIARTYHFAPER